MRKKIIRAISTTFLVLLFLLVVVMFMMRVMGKTPSLFGYRLYYVASGSMEPTLNVGDAVLIKKVGADEIHKGDIITYQSSDGEMYGKPITHRVILEPEYKNGTYYYQTQGDANGTLPDPVVTYSRVEGKLTLKLPLLGKLYSFFCKPYGLLTFIIVILVLFGYEMISLLLSYRTIDSLDVDDYSDLEEEVEEGRQAPGDPGEEPEELQITQDGPAD